MSITPSEIDWSWDCRWNGGIPGVLGNWYSSYIAIQPGAISMTDITNSALQKGWITPTDVNFPAATFTGISFNQSSDRRLKDEIKDLEKQNTLDFVYNLKPKSYVLKQDDKKRIHHGLIAQDVKEIIRENEWAIYNPPKVDGSDDISLGYASLNYTELIPDLVVVVQEQHKEIEELKTTISDLAERISKLENKEDK